MVSVLNQAALIEHVDNDWEFLAEAVELFNRNMPSLLEKVRESLAKADLGSLASAVHGCKGVISNFCADAATAAVVQLDAIVHSGDLAAAADAAMKLEAEVAKLQLALAETLQNGPEAKP